MKICFVAQFAYGAICGGSSGHIGGVERQVSLMARWFAARGHEVSLLCWDEGGPKEEIVDNVRVIKLCRRDSGFKGIRFFHPRWTSLLAAMKAADADVYYQNCGEYVTGQVAMWCQRNKRKFVFSVASNAEVEGSRDIGPLRVRLLLRYGLKHANHLVVQTHYQRDQLIENYGLRSTILPMPCPSMAESGTKAHWQRKNASILWAARITPLKQLELLLDVALDLPDLVFNVCGKPEADNDYTKSLLKRMDLLPNVRYHGAVSREHMANQYRSNQLFCSTSSLEGFPNTFLEAWSCGLPVVSTFDPDELIVRESLGEHVKSKTEMVAAIERILCDEALWNTLSENALRQYNTNYRVDAAMKRFETLFSDTILS